jgi:hypothetical protein
MNRTSYAIWDNKEKDFVRADESDKKSDTGFSFFISHMKDIKFTESPSPARTDKINLIKKAHKEKKAFIKRWLVLPAGVREYQEDAGAAGMEDINKLYMTLLNYTKAMDPKISDDPMFDNLHFSIQNKVNEIHDYIYNILNDKSGFLQNRYANRNLALGTRNVISAADMAAESPDSDTYLKSDETKIPLFQAAKSLQPIVVNTIMQYFFINVFDKSSNNVPLIDPNTYQVTYVDVDEKTKDKYTTTEGISKIIDAYKNDHIRMEPFKFFTNKGPYYLCMIYDGGEELFMTRNVKELEDGLKRLMDFKLEETQEIAEKYERPWSYDDVVNHRGPEIADKLKNDAVHSWRMETGIELIHKEPTPNEFLRICKNWNAMSDDQKKKSDEASLRYLGITNAQNMKDLYAYYQTKYLFDEKKLRPITNIELLYIATYAAAKNKHMLITRYPVTGPESIYPSKMHIITTTKSRSVSFRGYHNENKVVKLPEYPIMGEKSIDSMVPHTNKLGGLNGDFDGDTCSGNSVLSTEANEEIDNHLNSLKSIILPSGKLDVSFESLSELVFYNLTRDPKGV